jgi:hypothetical protein
LNSSRVHERWQHLLDAARSLVDIFDPGFELQLIHRRLLPHSPRVLGVARSAGADPTIVNKHVECQTAVDGTSVGLGQAAEESWGAVHASGYARMRQAGGAPQSGA